MCVRVYVRTGEISQLLLVTLFLLKSNKTEPGCTIHTRLAGLGGGETFWAIWKGKGKRKRTAWHRQMKVSRRGTPRWEVGKGPAGGRGLIHGDDNDCSLMPLATRDSPTHFREALQCQPPPLRQELAGQHSRVGRQCACRTVGVHWAAHTKHSQSCVTKRHGLGPASSHSADHRG